MILKTLKALTIYKSLTSSTNQQQQQQVAQSSEIKNEK